MQRRRRVSAGGASTLQGSAFARAGPGPNFRAAAAGFKEEPTQKEKIMWFSSQEAILDDFSVASTCKDWPFPRPGAPRFALVPAADPEDLALGQTETEKENNYEIRLCNQGKSPSRWRSKPTSLLLQITFPWTSSSFLSDPNLCPTGKQGIKP